MFKKLVAIEPVSLIPTAEEALHQYAEQVKLYRRSSRRWGREKSVSIPPSAPALTPPRWKSGWISPAPTSSVIPTPPQALSVRASSGGPMSTVRVSRQAEPGRLSFY